MSLKQQVYFLIDCNSFFCSCERLFRPDLRHRPVGVLSSNDGCFVARSQELRKIGVKMGEPYFKVKELCHYHQVHLFSSNFALYGNLSDRVMKTLKTFSQTIEIYSIDEAFLRFSLFDDERDDKDIHHLAQKVKDTVERHTGIPISIGVASTKTLAKIANNYAKKHDPEGGITNILSAEKREDVLKATPIAEVWGIGHATAQKMRAMGIHDAFTFYHYEKPHIIQKKFSIIGLKRYQEMRGIDHFGAEEKTNKKKAIMRSRSFAKPVYDLVTLKQVVADHTTRAAEKLRQQKSVCATIEVFIRTSPFKNTAQRRVSAPFILTAPTQDTRVLIEAAHSALTTIFKPGFEYKKAGVYLSDLQDQELAQMSLFEAPDQRSDQLMQLLDHINRRHGPKAIGFATTKQAGAAYLSQRQHRSPHYLTKWSDIAHVY